MMVMMMMMMMMMMIMIMVVVAVTVAACTGAKNTRCLSLSPWLPDQNVSAGRNVLFGMELSC
jgi:hypothetical protein